MLRLIESKSATIVVVVVLIGIALGAALIADVVARNVADDEIQKMAKAAVPAPPAPQTLADVAAFESSPDEKSWAVLHGDLLTGPGSLYVTSRIVNVLAKHDLPTPLVNAVAADLWTNDSLDALRSVRQMNVAASRYRTAREARVAERTSRLAWLLLAMRTSDVINVIDLTQMDLRAGGDSVGQGMNVNNVDFSGSKLQGGSWKGANITGTIFNGVHLTSRLTCTDCFWKDFLVNGTLVLSNGRWTAP